ncbi:hypothetical protein D3C85_1880600 [compost metagenome]
MLQCSAYPLALEAFDIRSTQRSTDKRIFGKVLKVPSAQWGPFDVDPRAQEDVNALGPCLCT